MAVRKADFPTPKNWPKRVKMEAPVENGTAVIDCTREQFFDAFRKCASLAISGAIKPKKT